MKLRVCCGLILLVLITACSATEPETATPDGAPVTPETTSTPPDSSDPNAGEPDATPPEESQADPPVEPARTEVLPKNWTGG